MTAMLSARDRDLLVRVLGLTASPHVGERATAAWQASEMLRSRKLTWDALIAPALAPPGAQSRSEPHQSAPLYPWSNKLQFILDRFHYLTPWEQHFATDLKCRWKISPKQAGVLARIYDRLATTEAGQ